MMWNTIDSELLKLLPRKPSNAAALSWPEVSQKLGEYLRECTDDDWDGQGADAIPAEIIESAAALATSLEAAGVAPPDWAIPTFESSVSFDWTSCDGRSEVEIEVIHVSSLRVTTKREDYQTLTVSDGVAVA